MRNPKAEWDSGYPHYLYSPCGPDLHFFAYAVLHPGKIPVEGTPHDVPGPKIFNEKFFWDLDDGGHSDKVGKPLKASSAGRWGRS